MTTTNTATENRQIVERAFTELTGTGGVEAIEPILSDDFVHHRPDSTTSTKTEWLAAVRTGLDGPLADMRVEVKHIMADGDHVVLHSQRWLPDAGPGVAVVDILRVADGQIAEIWEIIEPVALASANLTWWEPVES